MSSLKEKTLSGVFWTSVSQGGSLVLFFVYNVVLARLLLPEDFGIVGMALVFTNLATTLFSLGFGSALIQKQDVSRETLSSVFWVNLVLGFGACAFTYFLAPQVASYYGLEELTLLLKVMSLMFICGSFSSVPIAVLSRRMDFRKQGLAALLSMIVAFPIAIYMAHRGYHYWSIVTGNLLQVLLSSLFFWKASEWVPQFHFSLASLKPIFSFGLFKSLVAVGIYLTRNLDLLLAGKILGGEALGFYTIATTLALSPAMKIRNIVNIVIFPAFSSIQDDRSRVAGNLVRVSRMTLFVLIPLCLSLLMLSHDLIVTLYGEKWVPSASILRILLLFTLFRSLNQLCQTTILSLGKARSMFFIFLADTAAMLLLLPLGTRHGLPGLAWAVCASAVFAFLLRILFLRSLLQLRIMPYLRQISRPAVPGILLFLLLFFLKDYLALDLSTIPRFLTLFSFLLGLFYLCEFPFLDAGDRHDIGKFVADRFIPRA